MTLIAIDVRNGVMIADRATFGYGVPKEVGTEKIFRVKVRDVPILCSFTGTVSYIPHFLGCLADCTPSGNPTQEKILSYSKLIKDEGTLFVLCETSRLSEAFGFQVSENVTAAHSGMKHSLIIVGVEDEKDPSPVEYFVYPLFHCNSEQLTPVFMNRLLTASADPEIELQKTMADLHRLGCDYLGFGWIVDSLERQAKGDYPILVKLPYRFSENEPVLPKIE